MVRRNDFFPKNTTYRQRVFCCWRGARSRIVLCPLQRFKLISGRRFLIAKNQSINAENDLCYKLVVKNKYNVA